MILFYYIHYTYYISYSIHIYTGIFAMLDDECKLPGASDEKYVCALTILYIIISAYTIRYILLRFTCITYIRDTVYQSM